jgi:hypothetical protein
MSQPPEVTPVKAKDYLGNEIKVRDTIVYPVRRGSEMWMKKLIVDAVRDTANGVRVSGRNEASNPVSIQNVQNCIVVTNCLPHHTLDARTDDVLRTIVAKE